LYWSKAEGIEELVKALSAKYPDNVEGKILRAIDVNKLHDKLEAKEICKLMV